MSTHAGLIAMRSLGRNASKAGQTILSKYTQIEAALVEWLERHQLLLARLALVVIYVWFGALKPFGVSPANAMVRSLQARFVPFLSFDPFIILFALFEMRIGGQEGQHSRLQTPDHRVSGA